MRTHIASDHGQFTVIDLPPTAALVLPICRAIGLTESVDQFCPMKQGKHLRHGQVAEFVVLSILQVPQRPPLCQMHVWAEDYGLSYIYGHSAQSFNDDRIGRGLDAIAGHLDEIEEAIVTKAALVAGVRPQAVHWDLMHVAFSAGKAPSDLVCKGYGDGTVHERQVQMSAHMDSGTGLPLHHQVLPGNTHQAPLAAAMLQTLQQRWGRDDLIIVADRAGLDYDNIVTYRSRHAHFTGPVAVIAPAMREQLASAPREQFQVLRYLSMHQTTPVNYYYATRVTLNPSKKALAAAKKAGPEADRPQPLEVDALFIFNVDRQLDDAAKRRKAIRKAARRCQQIKEHLEAGVHNYRNHDFARRQVQAAVPQQLQDLVRCELSEQQGRLSLRYWIDRPAWRQARRADGRYILAHSLADLHSPDETFELYRQQGALERQFRGLNSDLEIHPLWLQKEARIKALVLLYFLAMIIFALLGLLSRRAGLATESYHTMTPREMLHRCHALRVVKTQPRGQPPTYHVDIPERQREILSALDLPSPAKWLRAPP